MLFNETRGRTGPAPVPSQRSYGGFRAVAPRGRLLLAAVCAAVVALAALAAPSGQAAGLRPAARPGHHAAATRTTSRRAHHRRHGLLGLTLPGLPGWAGSLPGWN